MKTNLAEKVGLRQSAAYALPVLGVSFLAGPIAILQGIYAKDFGLSLAVIASVVLVARLFDAITDPIIGYLSDRHLQKTGSRKIFIISGGLLFALSSYFLYVPIGVDELSGSSSVSSAYFLVWYLAFYLSWTLFEIPHLAWGSEISSNFEARNKLYSLRALALYLGTALFFSLPLLPIFETTEFTPQTLYWSVILAAPLIMAMVIYSVRTVPDGQEHKGPSQKNDCPKSRRLTEVIPIIVGNRPLLLFIGAFFFSGVGGGMWIGMIFIFVDQYLGLGDKLAAAYLLSFGVSSLAIGLWYRLANSLGKNAAWGAGMFLASLGVLGTGFITPGESNWLSLVFCMVLIYGGMTSTATLAPSLLSDISDYGSWKFGQDFASTYFSLYTMVFKANIGVGAALGLAVAGLYGFEPSSLVQTERALTGLRLSIAWIPALLIVVATGFIALTPISRLRHDIIRRRLERRTH